MEFMCECGNAECRETISLSLEEARFLRRNPLACIIVPGHEVPGDTIIGSDSMDRLSVVLPSVPRWVGDDVTPAPIPPSS